MKFEAEGREFLQTRTNYSNSEGQYNFIPGDLRFLRSNTLEQFKLKLEELKGFSFLQEKLDSKKISYKFDRKFIIFISFRLWSDAWCPLLQGMARLCCDRRSHIRTSALTSLQRALLFHDLQTLSSSEWEAAFTHVLFPMLDQLLIPSQPGERTAMEETRTRAATLLGKVYLQHLTPLTTLQTFTVSSIDFLKHLYNLNLILSIIQI